MKKLVLPKLEAEDLGKYGKSKESELRLPTFVEQVELRRSIYQKRDEETEEEFLARRNKAMAEYLFPEDPKEHAEWTNATVGPDGDSYKIIINGINGKEYTLEIPKKHGYITEFDEKCGMPKEVK